LVIIDLIKMALIERERIIILIARKSRTIFQRCPRYI